MRCVDVRARLRPRLHLRPRLQLREGGDEQRGLLALDQDFSLQPKAGAGNKEREPGCCAAPRSRARQDRLGPMLARPLLI